MSVDFSQFLVALVELVKLYPLLWFVPVIVVGLIIWGFVLIAKYQSKKK